MKTILLFLSAALLFSCNLDDSSEFDGTWDSAKSRIIFSGQTMEMIDLETGSVRLPKSTFDLDSHTITYYKPGDLSTTESESSEENENIQGIIEYEYLLDLDNGLLSLRREGTDYIEYTKQL